MLNVIDFMECKVSRQLVPSFPSVQQRLRLVI